MGESDRGARDSGTTHLYSIACSAASSVAGGSGRALDHNGSTGCAQPNGVATNTESPVRSG
jgi:hypothetical protein